MSILTATLRAATGPTVVFTEVVPESTASVGSVATLKDGNDATGSMLEASVIDEGQSPSGSYREEWGLDVLASSEQIDFLRFITRAKGAGPGSSRHHLSVNGTTRGAETTLGGLSNLTQDLTTDPADGQRWTQAKVNAQRFGWFLECGVVAGPGTLDNFAEGTVAEFTVEVWGPSTGVELAGPVNAESAEGEVGPEFVAGALGDSGEGPLAAPVASGGAIGAKAEGRIRTP